MHPHADIPPSGADRRNGQWEGSQLNQAKEILAFELTKLVHGEEEATKAQNTAHAIFMGQGASENMPETALTPEDLTDGSVDILTLLIKAGIAKSKGEGRRLVQQGGVRADGEKVTDFGQTFSEDALRQGIVIKKGKKVFHRMILK